MSHTSDDPWKNVIEQVSEALTSLGFTDTDDLIANEVRTALNAVDMAPTAPPTMRLIEGGLSDKPTTDAVDSGHLRPRDPEEDLSTTDIETVTVSVSLSPQLNASQPGMALPLAEGRIEILGDARQTIFRATTARPYRIHCVEGLLQVWVEGDIVDTISEGQSIDTEGAHIAVLGTSDDCSLGHYYRLV